MTAVLHADAVTVKYGGVTAVDEASLVLKPASFTGLIGPNGAGKTSLIDALTGTTAVTSGRIKFDGSDVTKASVHRRARAGMARTFQSVELFDDLSVFENVQVAAEPPHVLSALAEVVGWRRADRRETIQWALEFTGLANEGERSPRELSHGRRKLVGVARALALRPKLILLDEPAAGLDTHETAELASHLKRLPGEGITVLMIDHDMTLVLTLCEEIIVLDFGRIIAQGPPEAIRHDPAVLEAYLGSDTELTGEAVA
jgi:branched-chain amino acid transport system ATP-binding protein